ncbi:hypothetical protein B566_EDAN014989 [Ephemera danica]|nr:hypothetical protein B566_EDAN014989 [Ephemera danica]
MPEYQAWLSQQARQQDSNKSAISHMFSRCDVVETSYHFLSEQIDLHLCDDAGDGRSSHPDLKDGGAFQIRLRHFKIDYYPYHLALGDRRHWPSYQEDVHCQWLEQALSAFRARFLELIDAGARAHTPLTRAAPGAGADGMLGEEKPSPQPAASPVSDRDGKKPGSSPGGNPVKTHVLRQLAKLMTSCVILRLEDFTLYRVTTSQRKQVPKEFIAGDKERYSFPEETTVVHAEFTYFYYPGDTPFPLPPPQFYVHLNPIQINFDVLTLLWLQAFGLHLHRSLVAASPTQPSLSYVDVKVEAIMPRVIIEACGGDEAAAPHHSQRDRPRCLQLQTSRAIVTNVRSLTSGSRADLAACLNDLQQGEFFFGTSFPTKPSDQNAVIEKFLRHATATDNLKPSPELSSGSVAELLKGLSRDLLWTESKDVWFLQLEPVWAEFTGARASPGRPVAFLDAFPLSLWIYAKKLSPPSALNTDNIADIHVLAHIPSLVSVQINHYQFLFVSRLLEEITELTTFLTVDSQRIMRDKGGSVCLGAALPQLEVTFVMPAHNQGKESSGGDLESVIPDSSSLADVQCAFIEQNSSQYTANIKELELRRSITGTPVSDMASPLSSNELPFPPEPLQNLPTITMSTQQMFVANQEAVFTNAASGTPFKIPNNLNLSSMKKGIASGFTNLMTSFDSAMKASPDDASDSLSVRSDGSSDSDFLVVNLQQERTDLLDATFILPPSTNPGRATIEEASEVVEEDETPSEHSEASLFRRRDVVSVCTLKLNRVEVVQHSQGFSSNIRVQCSGLSAEECGCIPWDEFQSKFASRARVWSDENEAGAACSVKLRLERSPDSPPPGPLHAEMSVRRSLTQLFTDCLEAHMANVRLTLSTTSLTGLTDLLEDEILPKPVPMQLLLQNIDLHLNEDRSSVSQLSAANPVPLDVSITCLRVTRTASGTFHIEPAGSSLVPVPSSAMSSGTMSTAHQQEVELARRRAAELARENEELRRRLLALERAKLQEEQVLKARISELQGDRLALQASLRSQQQAAASVVASGSPRSSRQSSTRR